MKKTIVILAALFFISSCESYTAELDELEALSVRKGKAMQHNVWLTWVLEKQKRVGGILEELHAGINKAKNNDQTAMLLNDALHRILKEDSTFPKEVQ